jgi:hypothetical protein
MKSITKLKNPDIIEINNEKFQVIENTSLWYDFDKKEMEYSVGLVKLGSKKITPGYWIKYIDERPKIWKFFVVDKKTKKFKEQKVKSFMF